MDILGVWDVRWLPGSLPADSRLNVALPYHGYMSARPSTDKTYDLPNEAEVLQVLRDFGVKRARLFGSAARGELTPSSDIDILVEFGGPLDYVQLLYISEAIEQVTGRRADIVPNLRPELLPYVEPDFQELPL